MMKTPNMGLSLDTLGYVRLRQAYVRNMRSIELVTGLSLSTNIIGDVLFRRNVREKLAKITAYLEMPKPPQFNNIEELRLVLTAAMVRIDETIGGVSVSPTVDNTQASSTTVNANQLAGFSIWDADRDARLKAMGA